jgi:hypothetical protein
MGLGVAGQNAPSSCVEWIVQLADSLWPTEVLLTGSPFSGERIRVSTNRDHLARANADTQEGHLFVRLVGN